MAWASLLSSRKLLHSLASRTLLAPSAVGTPCIVHGSPFHIRRPFTGARQISSTSTNDTYVIDVSSNVMKADLSAVRSAIIQAVQELPVMTKPGAQEYAEKCFEESKALCQQGQGRHATVPWLKGYLSGIVYPSDIAHHDKVAYAECAVPSLVMVYNAMESILSQLREYDVPTQSVYNMKILSQYFELLDQEQPPDDLSAKFRAFVQSLDLNNVDSSTRLDIERHDFPLLDSLYLQFRTLTDDREDKIALTVDMLLGELRKGCILLFAGPEGQHAAAPFFYSGHRFIIALENDSISHQELLFVYQKQLPEAVFSRLLTMTHVYSQDSLINDKFRNRLIHAMSELPVLTLETFETYSRDQFEQVKQLCAQGRGHDYATGVLLFRGFLSRILYNKESQTNEQLGWEFATTTTLQSFAAGIPTILNTLHNEATDPDSPYTLGIMAQFNKLLEEVETGIEHSDLQALYTSTLKNIKFNDLEKEKVDEMRGCDFAIHTQFRTDLETLAESLLDPALIEIALFTAFVELKKACILVTAGGKCIPHAVPYLVNTYYITASLRSSKIALLLIYAYQQKLPPALFERILQFIWLFIHDKDRDSLTNGLSLPDPPDHRENDSLATQTQPKV
ncbi:hypothetical protein DL96DRAFT_1613536 [Flagelloscypha sp. PMI_526]|nr:hypothetical protein DL96DRAFT_1613536 [Flagelloscypha sp. PMI_526]